MPSHWVWLEDGANSPLLKVPVLRDRNTPCDGILASGCFSPWEHSAELGGPPRSSARVGAVHPGRGKGRGPGDKLCKARWRNQAQPVAPPPPSWSGSRPVACRSWFLRQKRRGTEATLGAAQHIRWDEGTCFSGAGTELTPCGYGKAAAVSAACCPVSSTQRWATPGPALSVTGAPECDMCPSGALLVECGVTVPGFVEVETRTLSALA